MLVDRMGNRISSFKSKEENVKNIIKIYQNTKALVEFKGRGRPMNLNILVLPWQQGKSLLP